MPVPRVTYGKFIGVLRDGRSASVFVDGQHAGEIEAVGVDVSGAAQRSGARMMVGAYDVVLFSDDGAAAQFKTLKAAKAYAAAHLVALRSEEK